MNSNGIPPLVARDATYYRAPDDLRKRISASIAAKKNETAKARLWRWSGVAAAFAAVAFASWNVAFLQARGSEEDQIGREVMTSHVRSLMMESHLNDVVSTDQHTVKPWFSGKLDFAPAVTDLSAEGFTLTGGRLDYLNARPVAVVTYRRRLHAVNLFEWPAPDTLDLAPRAIATRGFSMVRWRRGGLVYWAISDVATGDLLSFAQLLSR
jgi:anti-sigma factor RsiW